MDFLHGRWLSNEQNTKNQTTTTKNPQNQKQHQKNQKPSET
jgi:hypothetical protein